MSRAIGMLETYGLVPAIEGLDAAIKSANVSLRSFEYVSGGLVTWIVDGEVGAVRVSVAAGKAAASRVGDVVSDHVIARVDLEVAEVLKPPKPPVPTAKTTSAKAPAASAPPQTKAKTPDKAPAEKKKAPASGSSGNKQKRAELEAINVHNLRKLARQTDGINLTRVEIRDAKKDVLVKELLNAQDNARG